MMWPWNRESSIIQPGDAIIILLGETGSGKSTFIEHARATSANAASNSKQKSNAANLDPVTKTIEAFRVQHPTKPASPGIVLIDTPGYNGDTLNSLAIANMVTTWLNKHAKIPSDGDREFAHKIGIVYLFPITKKRAVEKHWPNIVHVVANLGPLGLMTNVVLATTMWTRKNIGDGAARESELSTLGWPDETTRPRIVRFENSSASAWSIIDIILDGSAQEVLGQLIDLYQNAEGVDVATSPEANGQSPYTARSYFFSNVNLSKAKSRVFTKMDALTSSPNIKLSWSWLRQLVDRAQNPLHRHLQ